MKKSRAANVFNKGMIMDLNPMVTPNDVMTNCLNGTLVTFNGNENVLQNDMGNGRVETAYLPEGYVPLGTAELGGIVYIVSYNPLNNKCQIGSFPSPERNVSSSEISDTAIKVQDNQFVDNNGKVINTLVKVKLLEGDYDKLNPGDKFAIYSTNSGISNNKSHISDVGSSIHKVDNDPKYVTIHVVSIGEDGKITYLDDNLKWDSKTNYYIKDCQGKDAISTDIDDYRTLVSSAYNVFSSKVPGELALIFELKTIDSLSITWDASVEDVEGQKQATVTFDTNWTSSNPKINIDSLVLSSSSFTTFSEQDISVHQGDVCYIESLDRKNDGTDDSTKVTVGTFKYSAEKDLQDYVWHYQVTPAMKFGTLDYLATSGSINFSEIGSGKIEIDEWRYYIQENAFFLNWGLEAYPEKNKSIDQVCFTFIPFDKVNTDCSGWWNDQQCIENYGLSQYVISGKSSFSGNFQDFIKFDNDSKITGKDIIKNSLYLVDICIKYGDNSNSSYIHYFRWIYTTGQWNNKYLDPTIKDFDNLTLEEVFDITADIKVDDSSLEVQDFDYYPQLYLDQNPEDNGKFSSMGIHTKSVNYDKDSSSFSESANVNVELTVHPDKYQDLFSFKDQDTQYTNSIYSKKITHSNINIDAENDSGISDVVNSQFMNDDDSFPDNFAELVKIAQTGSITQENNSNLKDSFDVTIVEGCNEKNMRLCVKGAIFSRINADFTPKEQTITQTVRPILAFETDYSNFNFDTNGNFDTIFTEDHTYHNSAKKQSFKFSKIDWDKNQSSTLLDDSDIQGQKEDIYSVENYWDIKNQYCTIFDQYIYSSMKVGGNPFCVVRMGTGGNAICIGLPDGTQYNAQYSFGGNTFLWARLDNDRFVPINAYWPSNTNPDKTIATQLRAILMQIYYIDDTTSDIQKFIVSAVNRLQKYTEDWNIIINTKINTLNCDNSIYLNGSISLRALKSNVPQQVSTSNISYKEQLSNNILLSFKHTFKCNTTKLYNIYNDHKTIGTKALYKISTKENVEFGNTLSTGLYVYTKSGKFESLSSAVSNEIIPNGKISKASDGRLMFNPRGEGVSNIQILNYLKFDSINKKVYFSQDLLNQKVWFYYISSVDDNKITKSMNIASNSDYHFIIGNHR